MSWIPRLTFAAIAALVVLGRGHVGRFLRRLDQRSGLFAPHGASLYDAVAPTILRPLYRRVADEVAALPELASSAEVSAVLEIGSGPGEVALEIARRLPGAEVTGVDLAETMIDSARRRARVEGLDGRVRFMLGDAAALPLPDASVDAVTSTLSMHHWATPPDVLAEIWRVLHPGGTALIYDLRPFAYTHRELEAFVAGGPFEGAPLARELVRLGPLPALFVQIRLVRPLEG